MSTPGISASIGRTGPGTLRPPDHDTGITVPVTNLAVTRIRRRKVLGGLIHEYERAA